MAILDSTPNNRTPPAYALALSLRDALDSKYQSVEKKLIEDGCQGSIKVFRALLSRGYVTINMSIPSCNRFIREGRWLNIYEAVLKETGKRGDDYQKRKQRHQR